MPRPQPIDEPSAGPRGDAEAGGVPEAVVLGMLRLMRLSRHLDEQMMRRQRQGKVGFYGAITGQEAVPAAAAFASRPTDWVFPALRECAILLGRGFPLATYLAQVYGSAADVNKGRQMPSHMSSRAVNVVSWSSCIGPQRPQAVGMAMAARRAGNDDIALAFLGDGATSTASFHAAMTFAGVYRAPVVFVCQNNHWAISVELVRFMAPKPRKRSASSPTATSSSTHASNHSAPTGREMGALSCDTGASPKPFTKPSRWMSP